MTTQVAGLVPDDVVEDLLGREQQPPVEAHRAGRRARAPARPLVADRQRGVARAERRDRLVEARRDLGARRAAVPALERRARRRRRGRAGRRRGGGRGCGRARDAARSVVAEVRHGRRRAPRPARAPPRPRAAAARSTAAARRTAAAASRSRARRGGRPRPRPRGSTVTRTRRARSERRMLYAMPAASMGGSRG